MAITAGLFPDIDGIFWIAKHGKGQTSTNFQHHLMYPTHWPVTYIPVVVWAAISVVFNIFPTHFLALAIGIYSHLGCDTISAGDGINWGAPWSHHFINLFASRTDGYHGLYWSARYRKTIFFKAGIVASVGSMILLAWFALLDGRDVAWNIVGIIVLAITVIASFQPIDPIYEQEPPEGRYADYRAIPEYNSRLSPAMKHRVAEWKETHGDSGTGEMK